MSTLSIKEATKIITESVIESGEKNPIIVIAGLPAAGKSTLVNSVRESLAKKGILSAALDKDEVAAPFEGMAMHSLVGDEFVRDGLVYQTMVLPETDAIMTALVKMTGDAGLAVLVDRPHIGEANQAVVSGEHLSVILTEKFDRPVSMTVWVDVDANTQYQRMIDRGLMRDQTKLADFSSYRDDLGAATSFPPDLCDVYLRLA